MHCVETTLDRTGPQHRESSHWTCDPLKLRWPEVPQLEEIAQQFARGFGNDDRVRFRDALQTGREVRRLADNTALLRFAGADEISDHHQSGGNPNPHLQGLASWERSNRVDQGEAGTNSSLGVILMRLRITEVDENAVAHVFCHEPAEAADGLGNTLLIGGDDLAQILWVHPDRERRRADEIREHYGHLATLGGVLFVDCQ